MAAALLAAAGADPVVESVANSGVFGSRYADNNHLGVVPTLLVGAFVVLGIALRSCARVWSGAVAGERDWLIDAASAFSKRALVHDVARVFGLQLVALFALESGEQFVVAGPFAGATTWLGGPLCFSVLVHAAAAIACTLLLGAFMRSIVQTFRSFLRDAIRWIWLTLARVTGGGLLLLGAGHPTLSIDSPRSRGLGGRAPPLLPIPVSRSVS